MNKPVQIIQSIPNPEIPTHNAKVSSRLDQNMFQIATVPTPGSLATDGHLATNHDE